MRHGNIFKGPRFILSRIKNTERGFSMYQYKVKGMEKKGNRNIYSMENIVTKEQFTSTTSGLAILISNHSVTNATVKGNKIEEAVEVMKALESIYLRTDNCKIEKKGNNFKVYDSKNRDMTNDIYKFVSRLEGVSLKEDTIHIKGIDNTIQFVNMINQLACNCQLMFPRFQSGKLINSFVEI